MMTATVPEVRGRVGSVVELRPYQEEAVTAVVAGLRGGGVGQLHAACGSGKTLIGQQATLRILSSGGLVVVLVPSLSLVAQTISAWRHFHPAGSDELRVLAVCSDDGVGDAPLHLHDVPAQVTTEAADVERWLRAPFTGLRLMVGTYASAGRAHEAVMSVGARLDMLILDEAHHLTGSLDAKIRRATVRAFLPAVRRLFMTATPRTDADAASRGSALSMDDMAVFGPVLYSYPFSRGIAEGYLADYRIHVVGVRESHVRSLLTDPEREYVEGPGAPSLGTLIAQAALVRAVQKYGIRRALSFHHRVDQAAEFTRTLPHLTRRLDPDLPVPTVGHVNGDMAHALRGRVLDGLRHPPEGGWSVVSSARCLGEGVDVPAIDAVLFAHPKSSAVDIVQAVGRALRPHPDSGGHSTIIVPLVVPEEQGEIGDLDPGDYGTLWRVIRALRAHDEPLGLALDRQRAGLRTGLPRLPSKITVELPPGAAQDIIRQTELMLVRQTTSPWWEGYGAALQYQRDHGHLSVPRSYRTETGICLHFWLSAQRKYRKSGVLSAERVRLLSDAGIVWDPHEDQWRSSYQSAVAFYAEHGHLDVTRTHNGSRLAIWIARQRSCRRRGDLSEERIRALDEIGMIWETQGAEWQERIAALVDYRNRHGSTSVPRGYIHGSIKLGQWVSYLQYRKSTGMLSPDKVAELERVGMVWNEAPARPTSARAMAAAVSWHRKHGNLDMPTRTEHEGVRLGEWLMRQRKAYREGDLPIEMIESLTRLNMSWERREKSARPDDSKYQRERSEEAWQRGFVAAEAYLGEHGNLRVHRSLVYHGVKLQKWLYTQRAAKRDGLLSPERVEALNRLDGFDWTVRTR